MKRKRFHLNVSRREGILIVTIAFIVICMAIQTYYCRLAQEQARTYGEILAKTMFTHKSVPEPPTLIEP
jgi:hypothetical protein